MGAARVVAEHPAQGAAVVSSRIGPNVRPCVPRGPQIVEDHARLDTAIRAPVQLHDPVEMARDVHHDGPRLSPGPPGSSRRLGE